MHEVMNMEKSNPYSFYVVLADGIMEIPQDSNLSWITLFYALPKELVEKRPAYLELPRNIHQLLHSEEYRKLIESETFLELVWDCYAWAAWQFFQVPGKDGVKHDIPGNWSNYSGDFPLWQLSYEIIKYFRQKFETEMEWSFQRLFLMDKDSELPWLSYQHFGNLVGNLTDMIVEEQNWQPMIDEIWNNRQVADYTGKNINKWDFLRSWNHSRTAEHISQEDMLENGASINGEQLYDIADPRGELPQRKIFSSQTIFLPLCFVILIESAFNPQERRKNMDGDFLLLHRMQNGDDQAIESFVRKYYPKIMRYCHLHIKDSGFTEDLTQETFARFFRTLHQYQHYGKAANYLYVIAGNLCRDYYRKPEELPMEELPEHPVCLMESLDLRMDVHMALERLPQELREVTILYFFQEVRQKEIARILGIGLPLVKYRIKRAKELLTIYLGKEDFE